MPEETQEPQSETTPEAPEAAPEEGTTAESEETQDWKKNYDELRTKFNERDAELSQYRDWYGQLSDPETQAEALRQIGLELAEEEAEAEDEYVDPEEELRAKVEGLEARLAEEDEVQSEAEAYAEYEEARVDTLAEGMAKLESKHGREFSDAWVTAIDRLSHDESYLDERGLPNVELIYTDLAGVTADDREHYLNSKKAPQVATGTAGTDKVDMSNEDQRIALAAQIIEAETSEE